MSKGKYIQSKNKDEVFDIFDNFNEHFDVVPSASEHSEKIQ